MLLDTSDCDSVVLEAESLMLVMDECLPTPNREANLLPERGMMVTVPMVVLESNRDVQ